jgi:hypothetical protein
MDLGNAPESYSTSYEMNKEGIIDGARHQVDYKTFLGRTVYSEKAPKIDSRHSGGVNNGFIDNQLGIYYKQG